MSIYKTDSVYRSTEIVNNRLEILETSLDIGSYDTQKILITNEYEHKPDKLAFDLYGNAKLWWIFAQFNPNLLIDPILDFRAGITIQAPEKFS